MASRPENGLESFSISISRTFRADEILADLPDISRAHGHDQIVGADVILQILHDLAKLRQMDGLLPVGLDALDEIGSRDLLALGLAVAHEINIGHDGFIRLCKLTAKSSM